MIIKDGRISVRVNAIKRFEYAIGPSGAIAAEGGDIKLTGTLSEDVGLPRPASSSRSSA